MTLSNTIEQDLKRCLSLIKSEWKSQNNFLDKSSNFIYKCSTLDHCLAEINSRGVDQDYSLHRWYNYMTSITCEYLFCEIGAIHEKDIHNHDVDIYINGIPFDVKLTVYPAKLSKKPYDLTTREGKNSMIHWYYANQSQQSRKQIINRIYVVCDGINSYDSLRLKSEFDLLKKKINAFMTHAMNFGLNQIEIIDELIPYKIYSELIYITNKSYKND
jgi:hypothetical protein